MPMSPVHVSITSTPVAVACLWCSCTRQRGVARVGSTRFLYAPPPVQRLLADRITHAETLIISEAEHSAYWEQPDLFNHTVLACIQRVDHQARSEA